MELFTKHLFFKGNYFLTQLFTNHFRPFYKGEIGRPQKKTKKNGYSMAFNIIELKVENFFAL